VEGGFGQEALVVGRSCCRFNILVFGRDVLKNVFTRTEFVEGGFGQEALVVGRSCCRFNILVFGRDVLKNVFARTKFVEGGFGLEALGCGQILLQIQHLGFWSKRFEKRLYTNGVRGGHKKGKPSTQLG
jgi:hypothetical protein